MFGVSFHCHKYISDNANEEAADHWAENVARGANAFVSEVIKPLQD